MVAVTDDSVKISYFGKALIFTTYVIATIIGLFYDILDFGIAAFDLSRSGKVRVINAQRNRRLCLGLITEEFLDVEHSSLNSRF